MKILSADNFDSLIDELVVVLNNSGVVCLPSDSCYGFSGVAYDTKSLALISEIKSHKSEKPLSLCFADKEMILDLFKPNPIVDILVEEFLPGPLTIIAETQSGDSLGIRLPDHNLMLSLVRALKKPIFTTSANDHGKPACYSIEELELQLGERFQKISAVLDLGPLEFKNPSTIVRVDYNSLEIIREGELSPLLRERFAIK